MKSIKIFSPAKVNWYLRVLDRRPDGYHAVDTVMQTIDLGDWLTLERVPGRGRCQIRCDHPLVPQDANNLCWRAYQTLHRQYPLPSVCLVLKKRIPVGAGLGGGSSNAAAMLWGLVRLAGLRVSRRTVVRLASSLGSDVPFFAWRCVTARARGRGDIVTPLITARRWWYVLVNANATISTKASYDDLDHLRKGAVSLTYETPDVTMMLQDGALRMSGKNLDLGINDLAAVGMRRVPRMRAILRALRQDGAWWAQMSGSGPTVYAMVSEDREVSRLALRATQAGWGRVMVAQTWRPDGPARR